MSNTAEEDSDIEQYFHQIKVDKLPEGRKPKFQIGDLVETAFHSDDGPSSYRMKGDFGLVCEVLFYQCKDYGIDYPTDNRKPYFIIEYKLLISEKNRQFRYVTEENLRKVNK